MPVCFGRMTEAVAALLFAVALVLPGAAWGQTFPKLSGRVIDAANVIPADAEARIDAKLAALESQSKRQLVVATLPSLEGYEISDYGYRLGRAWAIGDKQRNDGAILIVAPTERKLRIEVGYGLEGTMTDGLSALIINETIVPQLRAGNMAGGIEAGADRLISHLQLPEAEARRIAAEANLAPVPPEESIWPAIFVLLFVLFFIVLPLIRASRGGGKSRHYGGAAGPVIVWGGSGGFGSSSSGGGFGGGFSGGGGSFGGGGASGSW